MSKNHSYKEIHIPKAENVREDTNKKLVIDWIDKVEKAKREGNTYCYVAASSGGVTKYVVQKFIDAGYDIYFQHFMHNGLWFVKVHWEDGCCGRIYSEEDRQYVSVDEMFIY